MNTSEFIQFLLKRFRIEQNRRDRSGVYGFTQRLMAYNSNKRPHLFSTLVPFRDQMIITVQKMWKR